MPTNKSTSDWEELNPPLSGLLILVNLAWVIVTIFKKLDPTNFIFAITMVSAGLIAAYQLHHSQRAKKPMQLGGVIFFILIWLGMISFTNPMVEIEYLGIILTIHQLEFISVIPLVLIWVIPYNQENFFGIRQLETSDKLHAVWRLSLLVIVVVNIFDLWRIAEFLILIPMFYETISLNLLGREKLPVLTLFVQQELVTKFAVPISLIKSVFLIMTAFIFELLDSRFWLIVILVYFLIGVVWLISFVIPREEGSFSESTAKINLDVLQREVSKHSQVQREMKPKQRESSDIEVEVSDMLSPKNREKSSSSSSGETSLQPKPSGRVKQTEDASIQEKAHALGRRVRTGIQKPYYTLNHILSTLTKEDFSKAWKVSQPDLIFPSKKGEWNPPIGLILFPIDLEKYDYRRTNQILLLGFNRPFRTKNVKFSLDMGENKEYKMKITDNSIQFGEVVFNTRSLIVKKSQWNEIQMKLELVTNEDDISYTGFETLDHMQKTLVSLSDKWIELRLTAQEVAVNFLAGLLGASDPVFIPKEGIEPPKHPHIEQAEYIVEDVEDEV